MRLYSGSIRQAGTEEKLPFKNKVERPAINWKQYPRRRRWKPTEKPQPADEKAGDRTAPAIFRRRAAHLA
ncbi:hypothetical protein NXW98_22365 [Bacteroides caccae]|nr:hypothetical protein [Bacteroides caccae]MCS3193861.1 hypothetical protein [Bacteroides caccae]